MSGLERKVQRIIERVLIVLKLRIVLSPKLRELIKIMSVSGISELPVIILLLNLPNVHNFTVRHAEEHPGASAYNLESSKDFVNTLTYDIDGAEDNLKEAVSTVDQY